MKMQINPSKAEGTITAPPSKSMAHRALILGAFSEKSVINNIAFSKDITATLDCLKTLGANVEIEGYTVTLGGLKIESIPNKCELYCNESGSTLRFLLPLCMAAGKPITLKGSERLFERPLDIYEKIASRQDIIFDKNENSVTVCGSLKPQDYFVKGNVSSQFISGLLFVLPLLSKDSRLTVYEKFESASYVDLTLSAMKDFGIEICRKADTFEIRGNQKPQSINYTVEGDCSNAAFLESFNYLGGSVEVIGLKPNTLQGDKVYKEIFEGIRKGINCFDLSNCPDLAPVCFSVAAVLGGAEFTGTKRLKIKESDRAEAMKRELSKFGIKVNVYDNKVIIENGKLNKLTEILNGHNDHRIVMSLALLCSITGGVIDGAEAVSKSYPEFFKEINKLGIDVYEID